MHQRRRAAADSFRIGVLRNQSKSTVSKMMYKAMPKGYKTSHFETVIPIVAAPTDI